MALLDPRNGSPFDLPPPRGDASVWVMASVPRSGSTLLCRLLWDTGGAGAPKEYLNPMQLRDWEMRFGANPFVRLGYGLLQGRAVALARGRGWSRARLLAHLRRVQDRRSDATGRFGIKIHYQHFERWFLARDWSVEEVLAPTRWVRISREDRVAQAVSWARALQSGRWANHQRGIFPAVYLPRQIDRLVAEIDRQEAGWDTYFADNHIDPFVCTYEELIADIPGTVRRVLAYLDVPDAKQRTVAEPDLVRQADATSARWIDQYRARISGD